jgi:hypothetical protein
MKFCWVEEELSCLQRLGTADTDNTLDVQSQ